MRRILHFALGILFLLGPAALAAFAGEVIDGVVVTVNHKPIFRSDWDEAVCYELFMQRKPVSQVTETDRVTALQRLIDRQLLKAQMSDVHSLEPSEDDLQTDVAKLRAQFPEGKNDDGWQKLLAGYGLNEELLKAHLRTEVQVMNFVEVRLRPNVHVQPEEVEAYYKNQLLPDLEKTGTKVVSFEDVEQRIRELLTQQHMDELLDAWLHNLRQQAEIRSSVAIPALNIPAEQPRASGTH
jgi:SurA-like N-terminal domain